MPQPFGDRPRNFQRLVVAARRRAGAGAAGTGTSRSGKTARGEPRRSLGEQFAQRPREMQLAVKFGAGDHAIHRVLIGEGGY